MKRKVLFRDLGKHRPYKEVWDYQELLLTQNVEIKAHNRGSGVGKGELSTTDYLLFVEHNPVYTIGKSGNIRHLLISEQEQKERGIDFFRINRGGDITFHGPDQLVGYPILDLEYYRTDLGWYLRNLEEVIILTLADYNLKAERSVGETGVWLDSTVSGRERKICAMGIRCSRWVTMHGFALNVNTDLDYFNFIIPCGIQNKQVTSLQNELGHTLDMEELKKKVQGNFEKVFDIEIIHEKFLMH